MNDRQPLGAMARYGPFLSVGVIIALVLTIAPSKSPDRTDAYAADFAQSRSDEATAPPGEDPGAPAAAPQPAPNAERSETSEATSSAAPSSEQGRAEDAGSTTTTVTQAASGGRITGEDCTRKEVLGDSYPCKPLWEGDNGGATYKGATGDTLTVAFYLTKQNEAVSAVLRSGGLGSTREEQRREIAAYTQLFQDMYQFWGRKVEMVVVEGTADTGDAAQFRADAVRIDQEVGAALVLGGDNPDFIDELARRGVSCMCGMQLPGKFYQDHAPYVFSLFPDGDTTNAHIAEYICKRLGPGSTADFSGELIHPTIGRRGEVQRRFGLAYPNGYWGVNNAKDLEQRLSGCGIQIVSETGYSSDINTAQQQSTASTQKAIRNEVTTIICVCDPIAPVFGTSAASQQQYYPEWLMTGYLLQDADKVARLYDQEQWSHAFGVSSLGAPRADEDQLWYRTYKRYEPDTEPNPASAALIFATMQVGLLGVEAAGPDYNPRTYAEGMFEIDTTSSDKHSTTFGYGPDDFGGIDDFREVWWSSQDTGSDGNRGTYLGVNDHYRHLTGTWPASPTKVFRRECLETGSCGEPAR